MEIQRLIRDLHETFQNTYIPQVRGPYRLIYEREWKIKIKFYIKLYDSCAGTRILQERFFFLRKDEYDRIHLIFTGPQTFMERPFIFQPHSVTMTEYSMEDLPTSLETAEDYEKVTTQFVLPFLETQLQKIADTINQMYEEIDKKGELPEERIEFYINDLKRHSSIASPDNPMNRYFAKVMELENKLEKDGYFDET